MRLRRVAPLVNGVTTKVPSIPSLDTVILTTVIVPGYLAPSMYPLASCIQSTRWGPTVSSPVSYFLFFPLFQALQMSLPFVSAPSISPIASSTEPAVV